MSGSHRSQHYLHFGGVSPINGINRELISALEAEIDLPVYFGNRNWEPYVEDTVAAMRDNGIRRAAVFTTSAWGGYSSCTQYVEDIARARATAGDSAPGTGQAAPVLRPSAVRGDVHRGNRRAAQTVPDDARLVFTAHSIPVAARTVAADLYGRQVAYASRLVATAAGYHDYDQVWQSRPGRRSRGWSPMSPTTLRRWPRPAPRR